jgi:hypothetical protein
MTRFIQPETLTARKVGINMIAAALSIVAAVMTSETEA